MVREKSPFWDLVQQILHRFDISHGPSLMTNDVSHQPTMLD